EQWALRLLLLEKLCRLLSIIVDVRCPPPRKLRSSLPVSPASFPCWSRGKFTRVATSRISENRKFPTDGHDFRSLSHLNSTSALDRLRPLARIVRESPNVLSSIKRRPSE